MRRIKNSVKAIIVSCVAVVCVLAIVLGCIFGLKKDKKPNEPPTPPQVDYSELVKDINSANEPVSYDIYDSAPYASVDGCTTETLTRMGKNYFCYTDVDGNEIFYYYKKSAEGYVLTNLTNKTSDSSQPGFVPEKTQSYSISFTSDNEDYLQIVSLLDDSQQVLSLIYFGDNGPIEVFSLKVDNSQNYLITYGVTSSNMILVLGEKVENEEVYYENLYLCKLPKTKVESLSDIVLYKEEKLSEFTSYEDYGEKTYYKDMIIESDIVFICYENSFKLVSADNNKTVVFEKNLTDVEKSSEAIFSHISDKGLLLKFRNSQVEGDNFFYTQDNKKVSEEYFYYKLEDSAIKEIKLNASEGYSSLKASKISNTAKYFYVSLQKVENHNLKDEFLNRYYDADGNIVLEYKTTSSSPILYADDINFLTEEGLYKFKTHEGELFYKFSDHDYALKETNNYSDIFILEHSDTTFLMNLSGEIIFNNIEVDDDSPYIDLVSLSGHYFLGSANISGETSFYLIDANTQTNINQISNFYNDGKFEKIINLGTGLYLVNEGETYSLYEKNVCVQPNIKTITYTQNLQTGVNIELQIQANEVVTTKNLVINTSSTIDFNPSSQGALFSSSVKPYYDNGGDYNNDDIHINASGGGAFAGDRDHPHWVDVKKAYYYISSLNFKEYWGAWDGTVSLTSWVSIDIAGKISCDSEPGCGSHAHYTKDKSMTVGSDNKVSYSFTVVVGGYWGRLRNCGSDTVSYSLSKFSYNIIYYSNYNLSDNSYTTAAIDYGSELKSFKDDLSRMGYTFVGWGKNRNSVTAVESVKCEGENIPLYAIWIANTYNIQFRDLIEYKGYSFGNGYRATSDAFTGDYSTLTGLADTNDSTIKKATYATPFTVGKPTRYGYTFKQWYIFTSSMDSNGAFAQPLLSGAPKITSNTEFSNLATSGTVYFLAEWTINSYTIHFNFLYTDGKGFSYSNHSVERIEKNVLINNNGDLIIKRSNGETLPLTTSGSSVYYNATDAFTYSTATLQTLLGHSNFSGVIYDLLYTRNGKCPNISIQNSPYQIAGWVYRLTSNENYYYLTTEQVYNYLDNVLSGDTAPLDLYAVYNPRSYYVDMTWDAFGSSTHLDSESRGSDLCGNVLESNNQLLSASMRRNSENPLLDVNTASRSIASTDYDVLHSSTVTFTFKTKQPGYVIDFLQLQYFPYKDGSSYKTTTVTIDIVWGDTITSKLTYGSSNTELNHYTTSVLGQQQTCYYINESSKGTNDIIISYQRDDDNQDFIVTLMVANLGFAKDKGTDNKFDGAISSDTVSATGNYGFVVFAKVTSYFMYPNTVVPAEGTNFDKFNPGAFFAQNKTGYSQYYAVPVSNGSFYIGGTRYEGMLGKSTGYYQLNPSMGNSTAQSSITTDSYIYYDSNAKMVYYRTENRANYGNTEIIALSPKQAKVRSSKTSGGAFDGEKEYYELLNYLSGVTLRGTSFDIQILTRDIASDAYGTLKFTATASSGSATPITISSENNAINYFGTVYTKACGYVISTAALTYKLYVAYNANNNHVMYFLFSETESLGATDKNVRSNDIVLSFTDFDYTISVNAGLKTDEDVYYSGQQTTGVDVSYDNTGSSAYQEYTNQIQNVAPQSTYRLAFKPQNGYLIYSITVSIGGTTLYSFTLDKQQFTDVNITGVNDAFSLYRAEGSSVNVLIKYDAAANHNLKAFIPSSNTASSLFNGTSWGIYFSNQFASSDTNLWGQCGAEFETFYLLISGIYDNVSVNVQTISYFEFDFIDSENLLGLDKVLENNFDECRISILKSANGSFEDVDIRTLFNQGDDPDIILRKMEIGAGRVNFYRMIFFGSASIFGEGFAFFSSDLDYSNYFNNLRFYGNAKPLESGLVYSPALMESLTSTGPISHNIVYKEKYTDFIYFETGSGLHNFFTKYRTLTDYMYSVGDRERDKNFISDFKFEATFTVQRNNTQITTNSYLSNEAVSTYGSVSEQKVSGIGDNVIDGKSSSSSTITTNTYENVVVKQTNDKYQLDNSETKVNSWFNDTVLTNISYGYNLYSSSDKTTGAFSTNWQNIYSSKTLSNVSGYQIELVYYTIPGYYLQYIDIYTIKTGWFYIQPGSANDGNVHTLQKHADNSNDIEKCNLSYRIVYDYEQSCYHIYLYDNSPEETTANKLNSVGILAGSLTVNFYSKAHTININYNANVDSSTISTKSELRYNNAQNNGTFSGSAVYDSPYKLEYNLSMTGYTFIGWGSKEGTGGNDRFDNSTVNKWDSSSRWRTVTNYFNSSSRDNLLGIAEKPTDKPFDDFDFYVAGGYFVSDTGFEKGRGQVQNYNFWSAYANIFCANIFDSRRDSRFSYSGDLSINLYGIWKANTYNVVLNLNDVGASNGSTGANFARMSGVEYKFDPRNYNGTVYPGDLHYNVSSEDNTQSVFITFDTNDWYVVERSSTNSKVYSMDNFSVAKKQSLSDYVIDRYGYTWLGWFSAKLSNYRVNENTKEVSSSVTPVWITKQYSNVDIDFPKLNFANYNKLKNGSGSGDVSIVQDSITNYFFVNNSKSVYDNSYVSKFVYKNQLGVFDKGQNKNTYIYFYSYATSTNDAGDNLNAYDTLHYDDYFTYFDTAIDYMSYKSTLEATSTWFSNVGQIRYNSSASESKKINNFRSITLYAYWQTNLYTVNVDYRDVNSSVDAKTGIGSTAVTFDRTNAGKTFAPVFFDDDLETRLNKFIPVRLGYDFLGWSFNPQINEGTSGIADYVFSRATSYKLDVSNTDFLFISGNTRDKLTRNDIERLGDNDNNTHVVYLFAGWIAQEFSINVSLNIQGETLKNLYREDSEFALGLYRNSFSEYTGLKQSFAMTEEEGTLKFVDIVANISFRVTFDTMISSATVRVNNIEYHLSDLFATSAGYYLLGWLYNPTDTSSYLVKNTLSSTFDTNGNLANKLNQNGLIDGESIVEDVLFDEEFYGKLYSSFFVDGNNNSKKLSDVDFESVMDVKLSSNTNYFDTFNSSTNKSTNFGTIDGTHYLAVEYINGNYYMFYYTDNGIKQYVTPYIRTGTNYEIANTGSGSNLTFDGTNFYYNGYVVYYQDALNTYNAFYTIGNYGYNSGDTEGSNLKRIKIEITTRASLTDDTVQGKPALTYKPLRTRQITMYAHWDLKKDLSLSVSNGNNGNGYTDETTQSNHGLAGLYDVWSDSEETTTSNTEGVGNYEDGVEIEAFDFYENVNYVIYPFHNGRYLSEMKLTFYSYEDIGTDTGLTSSYQKVTYLLVLKFGWDSARRTLTIQTSNDRTRLERNGVVVQGLSFTILEDGTLKITGSSKLTNLDISGFEGGFMKILGYNAEIADYTRNNNYSERQDLNAIRISMKNVKSETSMVCSFSVQTFIAEFYNVFDPSGNNIKAVGGGTSDQFTIDGLNSFSDISGLIDSARYANGNSSLGFGLGSGDVINLSNTSYLPTIQTDCNAPDGTYNVPYGTFIYGNNQDKIPNGDDIQQGREKFGGYEYLYQGNYYFGTTTDRMNSVASQCSPILGDPSNYVQSARKASTLYSFRSWFEATETADSIIFDEYSETDESTLISRNIILFGYYYANNKPTNIQFFTWGSNNAYTEYTNNIEEYTLQSTTTNSSFIKSDTSLIVPNEVGDRFVNNSSDNKAIIMFSTSYGVDGVGFSEDNFTSDYIRNDSGVNKNFVNETLIRNYWYYRFQNYYLYFNKGGVNYYIRYDSTQKKFYYRENENNASSAKHYVNLYTSDLKDNTFIVYADLNPSTSGVKINNDNDLNKYIATTSLLTKMMTDDTDYTYNFKGSEMYAYYNVDGQDRYYKIKDIKSYQTDSALTSAEKTTIAKLIPSSSGAVKVSAKYYVKLGGKVYYLIVSNGNSGTVNDASKLYSYSDAGGFTLANDILTNNAARVTTIDNYFFVVNDQYFQVEYPVTSDSDGGYINPWGTVNTCKVNMVLNGVNSNITFYFDYEGREFYENYNNDTRSYSGRVTAEKYPGYKKYTPVNDNYSVEIDFNNSSRMWEYKSVKIRSLPDPTIGLWYGYGEQSKQYYGYIGYINMLESDLDYLVDLTLDGVDASGRPTDPNKQEHKDRIYDTLVKYIDRTFQGQSVDLNSLHEQARNYVNSYKSVKSYLANLITVSTNGFVYDEDTNIIKAVDVLLTCSLTLSFDGQEHTYYPTVKYRFDLITTNTSISENIYAIPIYCRNAIEFSTGAVSSSTSEVRIDTSKMTVQVFENIANNFTHMYIKENGDYLRFIVLNQSQYNEVMGYQDHPSGLTNVINENGLEPVKEESAAGTTVSVTLPSQDGEYYIIAYYNKSGLGYPFRLSDNLIHVSIVGGEVTTELITSR